ncbi:MAG: thioredoxin [Bacteroidales bacterium]|nr:thioredoxin [Bacteroidales bacterium]
MKKALFIAILAFSVVLVSCSGTKKAETEEQEASAVNEQVTQESTVTENDSTASAPETPIHLTTAEFKKLVFNYDANPSEWKYLGDKPAIIDFWATWCPPCKVIAPILEDLAKEYKGKIYIYEVDVDKEQELAAAFGIQSIPTLLFIPMTGEPKAEIGAISKETFKDRIDNFMLANQ